MYYRLLVVTREAYESLPLPKDRQLTLVEGERELMSPHPFKQLKVAGRGDTRSYPSHRIARQLTINRKVSQGPALL